MEKKSFVGKITLAVVVIIVGCILIFSPESAAGLVCSLFGIVMLIWGISKIVGFIVGRAIVGFGFDLFTGITMVIVGGISMFHPEGFIRFIFGAAGIVLLIDGIGKIVRANRLRKLEYPWKISMTSAIINTAAGALLTFNPFGTVKFVISFAGIAVAIAGIANLVSAINSRNEVPGEITIEGISRDDK